MRIPFGPDSGVIFFRADEIEGVGNKEVTATGKVELRTRRETVLADWLHYDFVDDEIWAKGEVTLRQGIDWITGPEARFKRGAETGAFTSPRFYIGENASRGSASEIRFTGPDTYEASNAQYTTCVAPRDDWFIRMDELEVDKLRNVGTGHDATLVFLGKPVAYLPWLEFPLSGERKSGFLTPVLGSSGTRGFDASMPYYLNLAPNYDATLTPRIMTKRGFQLGGQFRYLLEQGSGDAEAEILPHDRETGTDRYLLSWKHNQSFDPWVKGLSGYVNVNKVSDDTYFSDLADRVALTSLTTLPREGGLSYTNGVWGVVARAQAFQTLQDPTAPQPVPYNRVPQVQATLSEVDWLGLTLVGHRRIRVFPPADADDRTARLCVAERRHLAAGSGVVRQCAHRRSPARVRPERGPARCAESAKLRDSNHVGRRRTGVRAGSEGIRNHRHPDARAACVLRLRPLQEPEPGADLRHGHRRFQFRAALLRQPLSRQRSHRRRQSAFAGADVAAPRCARRGPSGCGLQSASASTSTTSASC